MAKKRGGLAGVWDRNKGAIKTLAPIAAGFIPGVGPIVGAALGAAMNGLDRPGKSGIGLDVKGAVTGGIQGYGGAKIGQAAKGGLAKMFAPGLTGSPAGAQMTTTVPSSHGAIGSFKPTMGAGSAPALAAPLSSAAGSTFVVPPAGSLGRMGQMFGKGGFVERHERLIGGAANGIASALGNRQGGAAALAAQDLRQQEFDYRKEQDEREEERRRRMAELLMPMFLSMQKSGR